MISSEYRHRSQSLAENGQSFRPWFRDWGNLTVVGLGIYIVMFSLWMIFEWGDARTLEIVQELGFPPVMLVGVVLAWRMVQSSQVSKRTRQAWAVISGAFLLWFIADSTWAYYYITGTEIPAVSLYDPAYLGSSIALAIGVLLFPAAPLKGRDRTRFWIDCGIIITGLAALTAYLIIDPGNLQLSGATLGGIVLVMYPISHMVVLIAVFSILVRRPDAGSLGVLMLLGAGLVIYAGTDFWWTYLEFRDLYVPEAVTYTTWIIAQGLLVISPQWHYYAISQKFTMAKPGQVADRARYLIPYVAAGIGILIVSYAVLPEILERFGVAVAFLAGLVSLIVARQLVTVRENGELRVQQAMRQSEERFRALVEHSSDMITVLDVDLRCTFQSSSSQEVIHRSPDEFAGTSLLDWVHEDDRHAVLETLQRVAVGESARETVEWRMQVPDGRIISLESIASDELDNPAVSGVVLNSRDITQRKQLEDRLTHQAYHDPLTGLPNRAMFFDTLRAEFSSRAQGSSLNLALLFVDIDNFKAVNDTLGHEAGDEVLRQIASRLQATVCDGDMLSRLAGDEFTMLLSGVNNANDSLDAAQRVLDALKRPVIYDGSPLEVSPSIGVALVDPSITSSVELLRRADLAMYAAKNRGPGRAACYEPWMDESRNLSAGSHVSHAVD